MTHTRQMFVTAACLLLVTTSLGCERDPEDLEEWRNAKNGVEKLQEWATSDEEPEDVRIRAVEILAEDNHVNDLQSTLEEVEDDKVRNRMVDATSDIVVDKWEEQDMPELSDEEKEEGARIEAGDSKSVEAKDLAYYLHPQADDKTRETFESILAEWLSEDWQLRDQLGRTKLGQLAPRAGDKGREHLIEWLEETHEPHKVVGTVREHGTDETKSKAAGVLVERAEEDYPDLSDSLQSALFKFEHDDIVPFLEKTAEDNEAPDQLIDRSMNALVRVQGERAAPFFGDLVNERQGTLRWVAATRLVEVMGKPAFQNVSSNLPLETDAYPSTDDEALKKDVTYFCNMYNTQMDKQEVSSVSGQLQRGLDSDRWPARLLAIQCAPKFEANDLEDAISELTSDTQQVPGWGKTITIGELAEDALDELSKS